MQRLSGNLQVMFTGLARTRPFSEPSARAELLAQIQDVSHVSLKSEAINGTPSVRLAGLVGDRSARVLEVFDEVARRMKVD